MPFNIEKSAFRRGEYVGYAAGVVWRITKSRSSFGTWHAAPMTRSGNQQLDNTNLFAFRLSDMSDKLAKVAA